MGGDVIDQWMKVRVMEPHLRPILSLLREHGEWRHGAKEVICCLPEPFALMGSRDMDPGQRDGPDPVSPSLRKELRDMLHPVVPGPSR